MGKYEILEHWTIKILLGFLLSLLGGWGKLLKAMFIFIFVDYATGYLKSIYKKEVSSKVAYKGLIKKTSYLLAVIVGATLDELLIEATIKIPLTIFNFPVSFRTLIILAVIGNEGISIAENLGEVNFPFPKPIKKVFKQLRQNEDEKLD